MYICICNAITQDMLDKAVKQGQSEKEVMKTLGVGNSCGVCIMDHISTAVAKRDQLPNKNSVPSKK